MSERQILDAFREADHSEHGTLPRAQLLATLRKVVADVRADDLDCLVNSSGATRCVATERGGDELLVDYGAFVCWLYGVGSSPQLARQPPSGEAVALQLFRRGFSVRQLIRFVRDHHTHNGVRLAQMTTAEVVRDIVIPETRQRCCAMVDTFEGGPQEPGCLMSHWWGGPFMGLVEAIISHASGQVLPSEKVCTEEQLAKTYWLCIFGVNQHVSICGTRWNPCDCGTEKYLNDHPLCEMNKFGLMMRHIPEHAIAIDNKLTTLSRIWVLKELQTALAMGAHTDFCGAIHAGISPAAVPSVVDAKASREEDRQAILADVEQTVGIAAFDACIQARVKAERSKQAFIDAIAKRQVNVVEELLQADPSLCNTQLRHMGSKSPLHFLAERTRAATEWEDQSGRTAIADCVLRARADPALRDALGRTPLHAACQWDCNLGFIRKLVEGRADVLARATGGAVAGRTAIELLDPGASIPTGVFARGYVDRTLSTTAKIREYLRGQCLPGTPSTT